MDTFLDYAGLKERLEKAKEKEKLRLQEAKRKRNVAAVVDFASNLLSLVGYENGARYPLGTSLLSKQQPLYMQAKENYAKAMNDYQGKIAEMNLFRRMKNGYSLTNATSRSAGFIGNERSKSKSALLSGAFEDSFRDYMKMYNRKNY